LTGLFAPCDDDADDDSVYFRQRIKGKCLHACAFSTQRIMRLTGDPAINKSLSTVSKQRSCKPTGWAKKTAHNFLCYNFAYSQSFFIIFGTCTLYAIGNLQLNDA